MPATRRRGMTDKPNAVVITGGLGYVGQSLAAVLQDQGANPVLIDNRGVASQVLGVPVIRGSVADGAIWRQLADSYHIQTIYHCAGLIVVSESVHDPARYFSENVCASLAMLNHVRAIGSVPIVFSSSAAVYGNPQTTPIPEDAVKAPISPYGMSKWEFEQMLAAFEVAYGQPWVALRYFNVAGAVKGVREQHEPETHLLPLVKAALRQGQQPQIFGTDYPTPDGTAIRDYIHMADLVDVHVRAADYLSHGGASRAFNVGSGRGHSVQEVMEGFERVSGRSVNAQRLPRRAGDPPVLVADIAQAQEYLGFDPKHSQHIDEMIRDIWQDGV
ncbi:UDP-glucose 4-epimerase GalE [Sulfobacillus sp. hq2]|nr:UDP-glucose 4-epimerase GalE [Sulfobacillus sp. hq2]